MTTQPPQSHFDLKPKLFDALLGTELFKKQKESLFSNRGTAWKRGTSQTCSWNAIGLFIHPGYFAQLLPPDFSVFFLYVLTLPSPPLLCKPFSLSSGFPFHPLIFRIGLVAVTYHCGFIQSLLTAKNTRRRRWKEGKQCLWCSPMAPVDCLNRASKKGQQHAMLNSFANNKAGKKSQRKPRWGCQKMVRYRAALSWSDK